MVLNNFEQLDYGYSVIRSLRKLRRRDSSSLDFLPSETVKDLVKRGIIYHSNINECICNDNAKKMYSLSVEGRLFLNNKRKEYFRNRLSLTLSIIAIIISIIALYVSIYIRP